MAFDELNQISKHLHRTNQDVEHVLNRAHPRYPSIERSRDIFDRDNSFVMTFKTKNRGQALATLIFDVPPPLRRCQTGCIHSACKTGSFPSGGTNIINVGESYKPGTVVAFLGDTQLPNSRIDEVSPSSGIIEVIGSSSGPDQITVCYIHDSCAQHPCVDGHLPNCITLTGNIDAFTRTAGPFTGPFTVSENLGTSSGGFGSWAAAIDNILSGTLEFPGSPEPIMTIYQTNRISPFFRGASSVRVNITQQVSTGTVSLRRVDDFDELPDSTMTAFTGASSVLTAFATTGDVYLSAGNNLVYTSSITGAGTWEILSGQIGESTDSLRVINGTGAIFTTNGVSDWSQFLAYNINGPWTTDAGIISFNFSFNSIGTSNSITFSIGDTSTEIQANGTVNFTSTGTSASYSKSISANTVYTCDIQLDLLRSAVKTRLYPAGTTPPDWEASATTAGEYSGFGYRPDLRVRIRNREGGSFIVTVSRIHYTVSVMSTTGTPPDINFVDFTPVSNGTVVATGGGSYFKTWDTNGISPLFDGEGRACIYGWIFSSDSDGYNTSNNPSYSIDFAGSPHQFGVSHACYAVMGIGQQTATIPIGHESTWQSTWFVRVSGEYMLRAYGVPNELTPHASVTLVGAFQTYNYGDGNAFTYPYSVLGGDELYGSASLIWGRDSGWRPFSFRAGNNGSGGGISVATGNRFPAGTILFQWGVHILNNPFQINDALGGTRGNGPGPENPDWVGIGWVNNSGNVAMVVRNVSIQIIKPDPSVIIIPGPCTEGC